MKILSLAADTGGCGFYRMRAPAEAASKLGVDITIAMDVDATATMNSTTKMVEVHEVKTDADLIIVQRPLDNAITSLIKQAKRQGIATVVEIDDDFSSVDKKNIAYDYMYSFAHSSNAWVEKACNEADHVTISTPQLQKYARHGRSTVLRNCVPDSIFDIQPKASFTNPRLGWTGSVQTHPNDLQVTKGAIGEIAQKNKLGFRVVGDGNQVHQLLRLPSDVPLQATGWVPVEEFYQNVADTLDIGIVPLELSSFNQAKSYLKGMEYAALGIPFVASPTREYELLAAHGIGKIAKSPGDWRRHLQRMIDRTSETERVASESRGKIEADFTYTANAHRWVETWEKAIDYRKKHHA